jgi:uncharacterized coiled-coil DUF342 family protein
MNPNKDYSAKYVAHLEEKIIEMRNENFELREKIVKMTDTATVMREQITNLSARNRKLNSYAQFFGKVGNTIQKLHSQFERAKGHLPTPTENEE